MVLRIGYLMPYRHEDHDTYSKVEQSWVDFTPFLSWEVESVRWFKLNALPRRFASRAIKGIIITSSCGIAASWRCGCWMSLWSSEVRSAYEFFRV